MYDELEARAAFALAKAAYCDGGPLLSWTCDPCVAVGAGLISVRHFVDDVNSDTRAIVVALAGGGVLVSASVVTLLLRNSDIAELNRSCPGGTCAASREAELTSLRHRALLEGPLGAAFGIAGGAAAGVGLYLMLSPNGGPAPARGGMSVFVGADGIVRLRGTF